MTTESQPFSPFGKDLFGESIKPENQSPVSKKFIMPPFSVLNARDGSWQQRKRAWVDFGIDSELGITAITYHTGGPRTLSKKYSRVGVHKYGDSVTIKRGGGAIGFDGSKVMAARNIGRSSHLLHAGPTVDTRNGDVWEGGRSCWQNEGTSLFDPVICELHGEHTHRAGSVR